MMIKQVKLYKMPKVFGGANIDDSVFTSALISRGKIQFFSDHIKRLKKDFEFFFNQKIDRAELKKVILSLLEKSSFQRGKFKLKLILTINNSQVVLLYRVEKLKKKKLKIRHAKVFQFTNSRSEMFRDIKTPNYKVGNFLKRMNPKFDDVLFLKDQKVLEFSIFNIFFIRNGKFYTPQLNKDILPGILRQKLISFLNKNKIKVYEKRILKKDLNTFSFCFAVNSVRGLVPVEKIGNIKYEKICELFEKVQQDFWINNYE